MQVPQSLKNIKNRISKFINSIGEGLCYLSGVTAILAIMIPSGFLVSLIGAPTISVVIVAFATPLYFGYKEIFDFGYSLPNAACEFVAECCTSLKNKFNQVVFGTEPEPAEPANPNPFRSNNNNQNQSMGFIAYAKSWCPAFLCCRNNNSAERKDSNYGSDLEEEEEEKDHGNKFSRGGYKIE